MGIDRGAPWVAGVDIGGTKVAVSLAQATHLQPLIHSRYSEPTVREGEPAALSEQVLRLIERACAESALAASELCGVGVSSCGPFALRGGMIELAAPNICGGLGRSELGNDWVSAPLERPLRERYDWVRVEIDTLAALEAERRWGALQGSAHCAYVTWSTGIGMGLCVDGRPLRGKNGNAGHAGHSFVVTEGQAACGCGNVGDVESLIAGSAIQRRWGMDAAQLLADARTGDALALASVDELCLVMGRALYNLIVTLDLQIISLGGSVYWNHRDFLLPRLQQQLVGKLPALTEDCRLVSAGLGGEVGDFGAIALVAQE